jgi:hypothetical protein
MSSSDIVRVASSGYCLSISEILSPNSSILPVTFWTFETLFIKRSASSLYEGFFIELVNCCTKFALTEGSDIPLKDTSN